MAKIIFSIDEFTKILTSNELLPENIVRVKVKGDSVHFYIKTQSFILPFIPASLRFLSFDNNNLKFELTVVNSHVNKAMIRLDRLFDLKLPTYLKLEHPNIVVEIEKLLQEKNIRGIQVKDVSFENGMFTTVTENI